MTKKFYLNAKMGCDLNRVDGERIRQSLLDNGWSQTSSLKEADLVLFNTCAVIKKRVDACVREIKRIKREKKKSARFVVCGCLPGIDPATLKKHFNGKALTPTKLADLDHIINAKKSISSQPLSQIMTIRTSRTHSHPGKTNMKRQMPMPAHDRKVAIIRTNYGCLGDCTFCAIKNNFPRLISRSQEDIIEDAKAAMEKGCSEITLSAEDLSAYGCDLGKGIGLISLLNGLLRLKGTASFSLLRVYPGFIIRNRKAMIKVLGSGRIGFLSIPVNSGSQKIIRLMNRRYDVKKIISSVREIKRKTPKVKIRFDIMVGFPGETDDDFRKTLRLVKDHIADEIVIYEFSPMPGTGAAKLPCQLPKKIIKSRANILLLHSGADRPS
ncbi:MAG: MiaB/RimO family radical SAM methylthiotransferase [archaeon]